MISGIREDSFKIIRAYIMQNRLNIHIFRQEETEEVRDSNNLQHAAQPYLYDADGSFTNFTFLKKSGFKDDWNSVYVSYAL